MNITHLGFKPLNFILLLLVSVFLFISISGVASTDEDIQSLLQHVKDLHSQSLLDSVVVVVDKNLETVRASNDKPLLSELLFLQGTSLNSQGYAYDAEPILRESLLLYIDLADSSQICATLRQLSNTVLRQRRYPAAESIIDSLQTYAQAFGDSTYLGHALAGRARIRSRMRDLAATDSLYTLALPIFEALADSSAMATTINGRGSALARMGRYREAAALFDQASVLASATGQQSLSAMACNNLAGLSMILGDPGQGLAGYQKARDLQTKLGRYQRATAPWRGVALCLRQLGRYDEAYQELEVALEFCQTHKLPDDEGMTLVRLGELANARKQRQEALDWHLQCQALGSNISEVTRATSFMRMSEVYLAQQKATEAIAVLDSAIITLADRNDFILHTNILLNRGHALQLVKRFTEANKCYAEGANLTAPKNPRYKMPFLAGQARAWLAMAEIDSARTCCLKAEQLWENERAMPTDPRWRERRSIEAGRLFQTHIQLELEASPTGQNTATAFNLLQRYKARTLIERILGPGEQLPTKEELPPLSTLTDLRNQVLQPTEVFLDFLITESGSYLFAVGSDTCIVRLLPEKSVLEDMCESYLASVQNPFATGPTAIDKPIYESLFGTHDEPISQLIVAAKTVFWSPDGPLHNLPLRLIVGGNEAQSYSRLPAASVLTLLRNNQKPRPANPQIFAVAGSSNDQQNLLDGALEEVNWLAKRYRDVVTFSPANKTAFNTDDMIGPDILHMACHGDQDPQRPWNCSLVLGSAAAPVLLRAGDVAAQGLNASLAFLASCKSSGSTIISGEGSLGLSAAFLSAGVPTVIATLWPVDDQSTLQFVQQFYRQLETGITVAQAVAAAQDILRNKPATEHPFHWASFIVAGDGSQKLTIFSNGLSISGRFLPGPGKSTIHNISIVLAILLGGFLGVLPVLRNKRRSK